jgi:hypothetical protein
MIIIIIMSRVLVTVDGVLARMIGFITPYIFTTRYYRQYSAVADLHTLQFTVTHAQGFSVFTGRILATDLSQSHRQFKSHMKSSCHSLIPFLPLFCNCQFQRLHSVQILCSQAHILESCGSKLGSLFYNSSLLYYTVEHFIIITLHESRRKHKQYF